LNRGSVDRKDTGNEPTVVAIAPEADRLKAVCLRKQGSGFEVLWTMKGDVSETGWEGFASECGLSSLGACESRDGGKVLVAGFDSTGVAFYRMEAPSVKAKEMAAIVRLQTEARAPLAAEQMEMAWRRGRESNGQVTVTVAAARKEHLERFVEAAGSAGPSMILLDCEGIVEAWKRFFGGNDSCSVVVKIGARSSVVCLAEGGRLANAVRLDVGMEDFWELEEGGVESGAAVERFAQDLRRVVELFGDVEGGELPIYVLSDGGEAMDGIVSSLFSAGLNVKAAAGDCGGLQAQTRFGAEEVYDYCVPLGLGVMVIEGEREFLDVFKNVYRAPGREEKKHWAYSPKATSIIAGAMMVLVVFVFYVSDVVSERRLSALKSEEGYEQYMQRYDLMTKVSRERPDLLGLLERISEASGKGIELDGLDFQKGRRVSITGAAKSSEQLYKLEKSLQDKRKITEVKIENASKGKEGEQIRFTMSFNYGRFTKRSKEAPRPGRARIR